MISKLPSVSQIYQMGPVDQYGNCKMERGF